MSAPEPSGTRRVDGCLAREWTRVAATSRGVGEAGGFVAVTLDAWGIPAVVSEDARTVTVWLLEWALGDWARSGRAGAREDSAGATLDVGLAHHRGRLRLDVHDPMSTPTGLRAPLELPRPFGSRQVSDADGRVRGCVLWCDVRLPG